MGGRGSKSGRNINNNILKNGTGFSYKNQNGKTVTMQINKAGIFLINGSPNKNMTSKTYTAMYEAQKNTTDFKKLSSKDLDKIRDDRYKEYNSHDYELIETGKGRGKVYRPRRNH